MEYRKKLILSLTAAGLTILLQLALACSPDLSVLYGTYLFRPLQMLRGTVLAPLPFSLGDLFYIAFLITAPLLLARWLYRLFRFRAAKTRPWNSLVRIIPFLCLIYILFFIGWGGNYYKPRLQEFWQIHLHAGNADSAMPLYDAYLIGQLNELAPAYTGLDFTETETKARGYFASYTDYSSGSRGLHIKPSIFGASLQYLGIQGYYNPFSGEAQLNRSQPDFMHPFVMLHEMAHQAGIAAEDDANLLAYAIGSSVPDPSFRYSAYLNIWLYVHARAARTDPENAALRRESLNEVTLGHLDTLRKIREGYKSPLGTYSSLLYDRYLRLHNQQGGIQSYGRAAKSAWALEQWRIKHRIEVFPLP